MNEYQQSLKIQRDNHSALSYAKKEGLSIEFIAKTTSLTIEEIEAL